MRISFIMFFSLSMMHTVFAQRDCGTVLYTQNHYLPAADKPTVNTGYLRDTLPNEIIIIPVVVHLLYKTKEQNISDDQILSQIEVLNRDFRRFNTDKINTPSVFKDAAADSRIMFCLARVSPDGYSTNGIIRKYTPNDFFLGDDGMKYSAAGGDNAWDSRKYLNIWVCSMFGRSLGYATIPGGAADKDGVVINYDVFGNKGFIRAPYDKGRTCTHEVGHWLGLKHLWGDEQCGSDDVDDTPQQEGYNFKCPVFPNYSACVSGGFGDMFMNFMDFTDDGCMNLFTTGQKIKMRSVFATDGFRNSFLLANGCDSSLATGGPLPIDTFVLNKPKPFIKIYPNPVRQEMHIIPVNNYSLTGKECQVYDVRGKLFYRKKLNSENESINLTGIPGGVYILKVGDGNDRIVMKLIKL